MMHYRVVCVKEFKGIRSNGTVSNMKLPVVEAIYTVVDENIDWVGMHSLILAELPYKGGFNSEHFRPLEPGDLQYESIEEVLKQVHAGVLEEALSS